MLQYVKINILEGIDINKSNKFLKMLVINLSHMFVMDVMIYQ